MIKLIIRLAIVALIANATWRLGNAYLNYYRFTDAVKQLAQFSAGRTEGDLRARVLELASEYDVPLADEDFTTSRENGRAFLKGAYTQPVELVPGYKYPWVFRWEIDTFYDTRDPREASPQPPAS